MYSELGEEWKNFVLLLITAGSDLSEVSPDGDTLLHKCIHHKEILGEIISRADRIKDDSNAAKQSPYTLASEVASQEIQTYLRNTVCLLCKRPVPNKNKQREQENRKISRSFMLHWMNKRNNLMGSLKNLANEETNEKL